MARSHIPPKSPAEAPAARLWYFDGLAALAFLWLAFGVSKSVTRVLGAFGGGFFFLFTLGFAYWFARSAWHGLTRARERR